MGVVFCDHEAVKFSSVPLTDLEGARTVYTTWRLLTLVSV